MKSNKWSLLTNSSIKTKLLTLTLIPVLGLIFFASSTALDRKAQVDESEQLSRLFQLMVRSGNLLHETQKERGATAVYMSSQGQKFGSELNAQRQETDTQREEFNAYYETVEAGLSSEVRGKLEKVNEALMEIQSKRSGVSSLDGDLKGYIGYYTSINERLLSSVASIAAASSNAELTRGGQAYLAYLYGKEKAGIERAQLAGAFGSDRFAPGQFYIVASLISAQNSFLQLFLSGADESVLETYEKAKRDASFSKVDAFEKIAIDKAAAGSFGVDSTEWFTTMTQKINKLKEVENFQSDRLIAMSDIFAAEAAGALRNAILYALGTVVLVAFIGIYIIKSISQPLGEVTTAAEHFAVGDINHVIQYEASNELGHLADSFRKLADYIRDAAKEAEALAQGDLTRSVNLRSEDDVLGHAFHQMQGSLRNMIGSVSQNAERVASASEELSSSATQQAQGASTQKEQTDQVVTAMEEMSSTVRQVSENSEKASGAATEAAKTARTGGEIVDSTLGKMREIAESVGNAATKVQELGVSSDQIGEIVGVIDEIADQTNLLALNAAIEAARAGEQGRGFAVVADEVRKLAERTTKATKEIATMIKNIQTETKTVVGAMKSGTEQVQEGVASTAKAGESLKEIIRMAEEVNEVITHIATAATEQSSATEEVNVNIEHIARVTQESVAGAQQSAKACNDLSSLALDLQGLVGQFKLSQNGDQQASGHGRDQSRLLSDGNSHGQTRGDGGNLSVVHNKPQDSLESAA